MKLIAVYFLANIIFALPIEKNYKYVVLPGPSETSTTPVPFTTIVLPTPPVLIVTTPTAMSAPVVYMTRTIHSTVLSTPPVLIISPAVSTVATSTIFPPTPPILIAPILATTTTTTIYSSLPTTTITPTPVTPLILIASPSTTTSTTTMPSPLLLVVPIATPESCGDVQVIRQGGEITVVINNELCSSACPKVNTVKVVSSGDCPNCAPVVPAVITSTIATTILPSITTANIINPTILTNPVVTTVPGSLPTLTLFTPTLSDIQITPTETLLETTVTGPASPITGVITTNPITTTGAIEQSMTVVTGTPTDVVVSSATQDFSGGSPIQTVP